MTYYVVATKAQAEAIDTRIVNNVRAWAAINSPGALSKDGKELRSRNAKTGELVDVFTKRWAEPVKRLDGKWIVQKPLEGQTAQIPPNVFVQGVAAAEEEYSDDWFPVVPMR